VWTYLDSAGQVLGYVYRFRTSDGGKEVLPLVWARNEASGKTEWHWMTWAEPRPLYGLDRLAARPDATVLLVEGEKCADVGSAELPDLVVVSWPGGGKAVAKIDWAPLHGRKVILWPDCDAQRVPLTREEKDAGMAPEAKPLLDAQDQPGVKAMDRIEAVLEGKAKLWRVSIPAPGEKPSGWDIADAVDEGLRGEALAGFIRANSLALAPAVAGSVGPASTSTQRPAGAADAIEGPKTPGWMDGMVWKERGKLEDCRENVFLLLTQHPAWAGVIAWDDFARRCVKRKPTPWGSPAGEWTSEDDFELGLWMAQRCRLLVKGEGTITNGVAMTAARNKFHPVREHLEGLQAWDGIPRLDHWLVDCLGAKAGSNDYLRIAGRLFFLGLVARVMCPGIKWDYMLVLEGPQGKGKSTALRIIGADWFADTPLRLGDKDAYMALDGVWLYEVGEMDSFNRAETTAVKAFVTTQTDHYREPYARRTIDRARQVAFAGTTNQGEYFKDTTGNRRFFPVRLVGTLDLDKLAEWRDQLLAEALAVFRSGARLYPTREEEALYIRPEQEEREIVDPWIYKLQDYLAEPEQQFTNEYTSLDLLVGAIGVEVEKIDNNRGAATRLGNLMAKLGWRKDRRSTGRREWVYVRPWAVESAPAPAVSHGAGGGNGAPF
jgi:predicted P-loop ATPase